MLVQHVPEVLRGLLSAVQFFRERLRRRALVDLHQPLSVRRVLHPQRQLARGFQTLLRRRAIVFVLPLRRQPTQNRSSAGGIPSGADRRTGACRNRDVLRSSTFSRQASHVGKPPPLGACLLEFGLGGDPRAFSAPPTKTG